MSGALPVSVKNYKMMISLWSVLLLVLLTDVAKATTNLDNEVVHHSSRAERSSSRNMVYFIKRGITIYKPQYTLLQRVKRAITGDEVDHKPEIQSLTVMSNITSRFSTTVTNSIMHNPFDDDKEATFRMMLPETAFMSNFTMYIDGELYVAEVKSKEDAEKEYQKAQEQNQTAGLVENERWTPEEEVRGMDKFKVSVNMAGDSSVEFALTYLELLERRELYEQKISVRPDQIVQDMKVIVLIYEPQGISQIDVIEPGTNSVVPLYTDVSYIGGDIIAEIVYHPNIEQQKLAGKNDQVGVKGELIVRYDVQHGEDIGLVQVEGDYFVHFFSPETSNLGPLPKNIVFVIDISGSMSGDKIVQTRESMLVILDQLRPEDSFLILLFDDKQDYWPEANSGLVGASRSNVTLAKKFVEENVKTRGGTNINDAVVKAAEKLHASSQLGANMVVFLTDGEPTAGETSTEQILKNVARATRGKLSIFSLGFGFNLNYDLLRAISFRNNGFARRIYAEVDAATQLQDFFQEINTPVLYDVRVDYGNLQISLTQTRFAQYFQGSEIVVTGKFENAAPVGFVVKVQGMSDNPWQKEQYIICTTTLEIPEQAEKIFQPGSLERLYVYMKIKDQLRKVLMTDDEEEKESLEEFALEMALEYHLVTPLTSFIIVQNLPEEEVHDDWARESMAFAPAGLPMAPPPVVQSNSYWLQSSASPLSSSKFLLWGIAAVSCLHVAFVTLSVGEY